MRVILYGLCLVVVTATVRAQVVTPDRSATFEAASIKLNKDGGPISGMRRSAGGRFEATNAPLATLIPMPVMVVERVERPVED